MYMAIAKKPAFKLIRATTDNAIIHCMYVHMQQLRKCSHVITTKILDSRS